MKILIVFTSLVIIGITSLVYITDINRFSEAKAFASNRAIEAVTLSKIHHSGNIDIDESQNTDVTISDDTVSTIKERYSDSMFRARDSLLSFPKIDVSSGDNRLQLLITTEDFIRLPIIKLDSISISIPLEN